MEDPLRRKRAALAQQVARKPTTPQADAAVGAVPEHDAGVMTVANDGIDCVCECGELAVLVVRSSRGVHGRNGGCSQCTTAKPRKVKVNVFKSASSETQWHKTQLWTKANNVAVDTIIAACLSHAV